MKFRSLLLCTVLFSTTNLMGTNVEQLTAEDRALVEIIEPTGLDQIHEIISNDKYLNSKVSAEDIAKAQEASTDGVISIADYST